MTLATAEAKPANEKTRGLLRKYADIVTRFLLQTMDEKAPLQAVAKMLSIVSASGARSRSSLG